MGMGVTPIGDAPGDYPTGNQGWGFMKLIVGAQLAGAHYPKPQGKPRVPPNPVFSSDLGHLFFVTALTR